MSKSTLSLAIPESMTEYIDARVATGGYGNRSEYIRELVRKDQLEQSKSRLRSLIEEGITSGPPVADTDEDWQRLSEVAAGKLP